MTHAGPPQKLVKMTPLVVLAFADVHRNIHVPVRLAGVNGNSFPAEMILQWNTTQCPCYRLRRISEPTWSNTHCVSERQQQQKYIISLRNDTLDFLDQELIPHRYLSCSCSSCWGHSSKKPKAVSFQVGYRGEIGHYCSSSKIRVDWRSRIFNMTSYFQDVGHDVISRERGPATTAIAACGRPPHACDANGSLH